MLVILAQLFLTERTVSLPATRVEAYEKIVGQVFGTFRQTISTADSSAADTRVAATAGTAGDVLLAPARTARRSRRTGEPAGLGALPGTGR